MQVAVESLRSQVKRLRRFPSVVTFLYSSDQLPPPEVEQAYLDVFHSERWAVGLINSAVRLERLPIPVHLSCVCGAESRTTDENMSWRQSYVHSKLSGVSGVKMAGAHMTACYFVVYHSAPFSHLSWRVVVACTRPFFLSLGCCVVVAVTRPFFLSLGCWRLHTDGSALQAPT